ncbi:MAG: hypothetical protein ACREP9_06885, partial [Candidatus Dormibacteraceae bacterium]
MNCHWPDLLAQSLDAQVPNFEVPPPLPEAPRIDATAISFIGYGRIVKQKHLPALQFLGFTGSIAAFDLRESMDQKTGQRIRALGEQLPGTAALHVVATPGPVHTSAVEALEAAEGPVLVEKPLCVSTKELQHWRRFAASRRWPVFVCHNYRFKRNVRRMSDFLRNHNPGELKHVSLHFQSPSVLADSVAWLRSERAARTLLIDYSVHFLDLACMFGRGEWELESCQHQVDQNGHTSLIMGSFSANYRVSFHLRQSFA